MSDLVSTSKFLSLILRHNPGKIGIKLDEQGWVAISELLEQAAAHGTTISRALLDRVVTENDKQRFAISEDGLRIRANQGHSVEVDLALDPQQPPEFLFHGTPSQNVKSILQTGINKGGRQHVHLSRDHATAIKVGQRRGKAVVLAVRSGDMSRAGHVFYLSQNGVWLTDFVPPEFVNAPSSH